MRCLVLLGCGLIAGCSFLFYPSGDSGGAADSGPGGDGSTVRGDGSTGPDGAVVACESDTIALFHFNAGALTTDACTSNGDHSFEGGGAAAAGKEGGGITFSSISGQMLKTNPVLDSPEVRFEAWVNPATNALKTDMGVIAWNDETGVATNMAIRVMLVRNDLSDPLWRLRVEYSNVLCTELPPVASQPIIPSEQFTHVSFTHNDSDLTIYIDGAEAGAGSSNEALCQLDGTKGYLVLGAGSDDRVPTDLFEGVIDEVRITANSQPPPGMP